MFGSLVVVYPSPHDGGQLVFRHNGKEKIFDSGKILSGTSAPSIMYTAFYSDVEHEVLPVTSGHRVTITYNLYFGEAPASVVGEPERAAGAPSPLTLPATEDTFRETLSNLLDSPSFLPEGGLLGFGLSHEYPLSTKPEKIDLLPYLKDHLKGPDALIFKAFAERSLPVSLNVVYRDPFKDIEVLCTRTVTFDYQLDSDGFSVTRELVEEGHGTPIAVSDSDSEDFSYPQVTRPVLWVTPRTVFNEVKTHYTAYGNEYETGFMYGSICLVVRVGRPGERSNTEEVEADMRETSTTEGWTGGY